MMKKVKEKGITLVAIVVTIIVMLILVGIVLFLLFKGGLFGNAKKARDEQIRAREIELIKLAYSACKVDYLKKNIPIDLERFQEAMHKNEEKTVIKHATDEESQARRNSYR